MAGCARVCVCVCALRCVRVVCGVWWSQLGYRGPPDSPEDEDEDEDEAEEEEADEEETNGDGSVSLSLTPEPEPSSSVRVCVSMPMSSVEGGCGASLVATP